MDPGLFFTTSAALVDLVDRTVLLCVCIYNVLVDIGRVLVVLRDDKKFFGVFRSYDQFG